MKAVDVLGHVLRIEAVCEQGAGRAGDADAAAAGLAGGADLGA